MYLTFIDTSSNQSSPSVKSTQASTVIVSTHNTNPLVINTWYVHSFNYLNLYFFNLQYIF